MPDIIRGCYIPLSLFGQVEDIIGHNLRRSIANTVLIGVSRIDYIQLKMQIVHGIRRFSATMESRNFSNSSTCRVTLSTGFLYFILIEPLNAINKFSFASFWIKYSTDPFVLVQNLKSFDSYL